MKDKDFFIEIKSEWQKDDCSFCDEKAKFQLRNYVNNSIIRFCGSLVCLNRAKKISK